MAATQAGLKPPKPLVLGENMAESWKSWTRQFVWFATATQLQQKPAQVQVATFMTAIGPDCVRIFDTFNLTPQEENNLGLIKAKFDEYFIPKSCVTYERYVFNKITQNEDEPTETFITRVKEQAKKCDFAQLHDSLVKDRIIIGVKFTKLVPQLLNDALTLDKTIEMCRNHELTTRQSKAMVSVVADERVEVVRVDKKKERKSDYKVDKKINKPKTESEHQQSVCDDCGMKHKKNKCPANDQECFNCNRKGHFIAKCPSKKEKKIHAVLETEEQSGDSSEEELFIGALESLDDGKDWYETVAVNNSAVSVKLDTGAHCNVLPLWIARQWKLLPLRSSPTKWLVTFSNHKMKVLGEVAPECVVKNQVSRITFKVVEEKVVPLLGRKTCTALKLITRVDALELDDFDVYEGLGCLKGYIYDIDLVDNAQWETRPARHVPHSIRGKAKKELDLMEKLEVIERIHEPTPVVNAMVLVSRNGKLRICIDPSQVNQNLLRRHHPLTTIEEISARLKDSTCFTILDCKKGFWQIRVTDRTAKYLTFGTPWGRYCCKRLPFGLASAPEVFQKVMYDILEGLDGVECSMDDILIHAADQSRLETITKEVIRRIIAAGLKLNKEKCLFNQTKVKFLGHLVTTKGLMADPEKLEAVQKLKTPSNKTQLQRALGMITYLAKFVPNLSDITAPLRVLLSKDAAWLWEKEHDDAFQNIKKMMVSPPVLAFYDVNLPVTLSVDASSKALGAILMQVGKPIAYASKALSKAELNYPQIEKEAAAIRFACQKFHQYIYGKELTVETDHKPLESIFRKPLDRAPPRLRRIRLEVSQYNPQVVYVKGKNIPIPDILSRDVAHEGESESEEQLEVHIVLQISKKSCLELREHTEADAEMRLLKQVVLTGWPDRKEDVDPSLRKYWSFRDELAVYEGLVFKSNQVVVPLALRRKMLNAIHSGHSGIQSCTRRAKQVVFWVNMNTDIQNMVESCSACQRHQRSNTKNSIITKDVPDLPFERVATDLFHYRGSDFVVIVDSYSNFFDFKRLPEPSSDAVIREMKAWFAVHGIPRIVESDNGPQYSSEKFRKFADEWGFDHSTSSPHFPRANGLAERYVQVCKNILKKCAEDDSDVLLAMLHARNTPRSETIPSPNERLMGRLVRSNLPTTTSVLQPKVVENVKNALIQERAQQKIYADRGACNPPQLATGDKVQLQDPKSKLWTPGEVLQQLDDGRSYIVSDGEKILRRNSHHLRRSKQNEDDIELQAANTSNERSETDTEHKPAEQPTVHNKDCGDLQPQGYSTRSGRTIKTNKQTDFEYY